MEINYQLIAYRTMNYVSSILNEPIINEEYANTLVEILIADTANDIVDQISKISDSDRHDKEIIAAVELAIILDSCINRDIIYSLIDIAKFWDIWACWANVKLSYYQGTHDELYPNDYYSKENFDLIYQKSREWSNKILNS